MNRKLTRIKKIIRISIYSLIQ